MIRKGTQDYHDFWAFVSKYQSFQKRQHQQQKKRKSKDERGKKKTNFELPQTYDKRYRVNLSFVSKDIEVYLQQGIEHREESKELTRERLAQFRQIILHYIDFCQKQKFAKLVKIQKDKQNLPIFQYKEKIVEMVSHHQVVVVAGDTGCGKSTQVPQYLLEGGFTNIACTQPRRIACISLSKRVGYETLNEYGSEVAYQVRFEKTKTRNTRILFLTEGLLLRQMQSDTVLSQYDVIVIDEVHERHIHTDFLLGILKCLLRQRDDLKLVLMSATINIELFSGYFDDCPVVKVPGRLYPIRLEYCPITVEEQSSKTERLDPRPYLRIMQKIDHKYPESERGDLLVFLSGMSEIMSVVEAAKTYAQKTKRWIILPLHSALSIEEQDKVFDVAPEGARKCIVSTNIAETSVTIDGVRFIVDSGKVKEMNFDNKSKMQKLQECWISQASSEQRKGRAGRTGPGVCFRLYDESDYKAFEEYSTPEIQRVPLDSLILQMVSMGLPDARKFPFLENPAMSSIELSIAFLKEQAALTTDEKLTPIGEMLANLPVDIVMGKMLIMGSIFHMMDPVLSITSALSVQSPFTMKAHSDPDALSQRKPLESDSGDPFTLLNAFDEWIQVKAEGHGTRKWCRRRGLEEQRFYEMAKLKQQFRELLQDHNLLEGEHEHQKYFSAEERKKRFKDRKRLRDLQHQQRSEVRKRKVLKVEEEYELSDWEAEEDAVGDDVKDLEFRLRHDLDQLQEKSNKNRHFSMRDINLLKVILCSGLFPQIAIADEQNSYKSDTEQAFHTKSKQFLILHPTSVFATHPETLELQDKDILSKSGSDATRYPMSHKHQLLAYVSLLETTKPYLVGAMRVPAMQTLLLYSSSLDTNTDLTRVVCESWLEIKFDQPEDAEHMISSVVHLRSTWQKLIKLKLRRRISTSVEDKLEEEAVYKQARKLERLLASKLTEFLDSRAVYSIRRIMSAEIKHLYKGPTKDCTESSSVVSELLKNSGEPHPTKGGYKVNDFFTYDCLGDEEGEAVWGGYSSCMQKHWTCPKCQQHLIVTVVERIKHEQDCDTNRPKAGNEEESALTEQKSSMKKSQKIYHCSSCDKEYEFSPIEVLRHKKNCKI